MFATTFAKSFDTRFSPARSPLSRFSWYPEELDNGEIFTVSITITPEIANEMLSTSVGNPRGREKDSVINHYRNEMQAGTFEDNFIHGIGFDKDGHLFDGHNRLKALTQANHTVTMRVNFNAISSPNVDRPDLRRDSDVLQNILHVDNANIGTIATLNRMFFRDAQRNGKLSITDKRQYLQEWGDYIAFAHENIPTHRLYVGFANSATRAAVARAVGSRPAKREKIANFCRTLISGEAGNGEHDPAIRLRKKMLMMDKISPNQHWLVYRWTEIALDAYLRDRNLKSLSTRGEEWRYERFLIPGESN